MRHLRPPGVPSRRRGMRLTSLAAAGAVAATLSLAACSSPKGSGSSSANPQQAVTTAVDNLGKESGIRLTFSLPLKTSQIQQLSKSSSSTTMPQAQAQALSSGSVFLSVSTGHGEALDSKQAATDKGNALDLGLTVNGNTPLEVRYVTQALYVHAQIAQLMSDVGQSNNASAAKIASTLQTADRYVPGLAALGQGKWVEISKQSLQSLQPYLKQLEQQAQQQSGTTQNTLSQAQVQNLVAKLAGDLRSALNGNVTYAGMGSAQGRSEYSATINLSGFATTILPLLQRDLSTVPGVGSIVGSNIAKAEKSVPAGKTAVVDLYVSNNKLSEADLDVSQFMQKNKPSFAVPIRLAIDNPGTITAPAGATQLDLSRLPALLGGLLGGGLGSSGSSPGSTASAGA